MIFSHFSLKYLNTAAVNIFRIKTNEYSISIKVCLAAPVDLTGNLPLSETNSHTIHIFIVSSNRFLEQIYNLSIILVRR